MGGGSSKYSPRTTSVEIMKEFGDNAKDKYVIVTGGNSGLGFESSRALAEYGAHVVIACRNPQLGKEAVDKIKAKHPNADVSTMVLDLASLASVAQFAEEYRATKKPLHILLNNAGVMACPKSFTKDGHEMQFGVNHLGHFLLTVKLIDILQASSTPEQPARIVNLSSIGHYLVGSSQGLRLDDLKGEKDYDVWDRYASSKMANIVFTRELHHRYYVDTPNAKVISVAVHPGFINETNLGRHGHVGPFLAKCVAHLKLRHVLFGVFKNTEQGTSTQLFAALSPDIVPGEYYADCKIEDKLIHAKAKDEQLAHDLWRVSCELTNLSG
mmetsp:Transcript_8427/g.9202  ORF Transcript_8427/g.9202 Transcript_8427/m.9202 type:complete len:326 (-) Transcript_8427:150-1127(-)